MSTRQVATGQITNNTPFDMMLQSADLSWGNWLRRPLATIFKGASQQAFIGQGKPWTASGTQGSLQYALIEGPPPPAGQPVPPSAVLGMITVNFDDPWSGSNSTAGTVSSTPRFTVSAFVPSSGSAVTFIYQIAGK